MNAMENLLTRRSFRQYKQDPIPQDVLDQINTEEALAKSYEAVKKIGFTDVHYRTDIGKK